MQSIPSFRSLFLLFALLAPASLLAQGGGEQFSFDDIVVDDAKQYYVAVGGGYAGMMTFANNDELNKVSAKLGLPAFDGPMTMHGGGGLVSLLFVPNLRLGVYGAGGSKAVVQVTDTVQTTLRFGTAVTGVQIDYAVRLFKAFTMLPGVMVGPETYSLEMTRSEKGGADFDGLFSSNQGLNRSANISNSHVFYYPSINFEYAITQFFMLRLGAGYKGTFGDGTWTDAGDVAIRNAPAINANGLSVQFGLFLGLFQSQ